MLNINVLNNSFQLDLVQTGNSEPDDVTKRGSHDRRSPQDFVMITLSPGLTMAGCILEYICDLMYSSR